MKSKKRQDNIAKARHVAIYIVRNLTNLPLQTIGQLFNRDHTTMMNSIKSVEKEIESKPLVEMEIQEMIKEITE